MSFLIVLALLQGLGLQPGTGIVAGPVYNDAAAAAYATITGERNPERRKKLLLAFEKSYPNSTRLAEVYMDLTRMLASQTDFAGAVVYAEKAVAAANKLKSEAAANNQAWQGWVAALAASAQKNLTWAKEMRTWQQKQIQASVLGRR